METFTHTVQDKNGIHARPAGLLVKVAAGFASKISVEKNGNIADAKRLFALMQLGIKYQDTVSVSVSGDDEKHAAEKLKLFMEQNW